MSDEPGYGLVMPFVTVTSKGGPHDDESYTAGYAMGILDAMLASGIPKHAVTILAVSEPQADLLAMQYGYRSVIGDVDNEWAFASFTKITEGDLPEESDQ